MNPEAPFRIINVSWIAFGIYWFIAAFRIKRAQKRETAGEQLLQILLTGFAFFLLSARYPLKGVWNGRFLPQAQWIEMLGAGMTAAGVGFAIWARYHIGQNWSATVSIRAGHELVRTGPYARIRHPIYTGILLGLVGTALAVGEYRGIVAVGLALAAFVIKAKREERFLSAEFGTAFVEHKRVTAFFLPRIT